MALLQTRSGILRRRQHNVIAGSSLSGASVRS
jgi:hypothetical protein